MYLLKSVCYAVVDNVCKPLCLSSGRKDQMDEGLAGRRRQYEGQIHNLTKELNHYRTANLELSNKLRDVFGSVSQPKELPKGKV